METDEVTGFFQWNVSEKVSHFFILFAFELCFFVEGFGKPKQFSTILPLLSHLLFMPPLPTTPTGKRSLELSRLFFFSFSHSKFSKDFQLGGMGLNRSAEREKLKSELPQAVEKVHFTVLSFQKEIGGGRSAERKITILIFLEEKKKSLYVLR